MAYIKFGLVCKTIVESTVSYKSGLTVKLIKPGSSWGAENGSTIIDLPEKSSSGYYEDNAVPEGYYEVWDDRDDIGGSGSDSGRRVQVGKVQSESIADNAVTNSKLEQSVQDKLSIFSEE